MVCAGTLDSSYHYTSGSVLSLPRLSHSCPMSNTFHSYIFLKEESLNYILNSYRNVRIMNNKRFSSSVF